MISRRSLFRGLGALLATPAVAKVARLIPPVEAARVRSVNYLTLSQYQRMMVEMFARTNGFLTNINDQFSDEFGKEGAKIGSQLRIRLPSDYRLNS